MFFVLEVRDADDVGSVLVEVFLDTMERDRTQALDIIIEKEK